MPRVGIETIMKDLDRVGDPDIEIFPKVILSKEDARYITNMILNQRWAKTDEEIRAVYNLMRSTDITEEYFNLMGVGDEESSTKDSEGGIAAVE